MTSSREERLRQANKRPVVPKADQPSPAKREGDDTPNPLPDDPDSCGGEGGDSGRTS